MASIAEELRRALAGRTDVALALLFGSQARGRATPTSDVDVAVEAAADVDVLELARALTLAVGRDVDVVRLDAAGVPLLDEILRDGIVVHEGHPSANARWRARTLSTLETDRPWFARMRDAWLRRVAERGI